MDLGLCLFFPRQGLSIGLSVEEARLSTCMRTHIQYTLLHNSCTYMIDKSHDETTDRSVSVRARTCALQTILTHVIQ